MSCCGRKGTCKVLGFCRNAYQAKDNFGVANRPIHDLGPWNYNYISRGRVVAVFGDIHMILPVLQFSEAS